MIKITFPDGSVREYNEGVTGLQIAESISSRLAQDVLACGVNGEVYDLGRPINEDAEVVLYKWEDEQGKHAFWHTSAHLLAEALQELYPGIQFGIGPAIENGFYYDVDPGETAIKEADLPAIEKKMAELKAHLEAVRQSQKADEDAEIVRSIRSMNVKGWDLLRLLDSIQNGTVELRPVEPSGNSGVLNEDDTLETLPDFDGEETGLDNQTPDEASESEE